MLLGEKIEKAIKSKGKSVDDVARAIGMSDVNLYRLFKKDSCETKYLQKLCMVLELPMKVFFEENWDVNGVNNASLQGRDNFGSITMSVGHNFGSIKECEKELTLRDKEIKMLHSLIDRYQQLLDSKK